MKQMGKIILCVALLSLHGLVNSQTPGWHPDTDFKITHIDSSNFPALSITLMAMHSGLSHKLDSLPRETFINENGLSCTIEQTLYPDTTKSVELTLFFDPGFLKKSKKNDIVRLNETYSSLKPINIMINGASGYKPLSSLQEASNFQFNLQEELVGQAKLAQYAENKSYQSRTERVFLFFIDTKAYSENQMVDMEKTLAHLGRMKRISVGVIHNGKQSSLSPSPDLVDLLFVQTDKGFESTNFYIDELISLKNQSFFTLSLKSPDLNPQYLHRFYKVLLGTHSIQFSISYPEEFLKQQIATYCQANIMSLIEVGHYQSALQELDLHANQLEAACQQELADSILTHWNSAILASDDADEISTLLDATQKYSRYYSEELPFFRKIKLSLLKKCYNYLSSRGAGLDKQLGVCKKIVDLEPGNVSYQFAMYSLQGKKLIEQKQYWDAVKAFHNAMQIKHEQEVLSRFENTLNAAIKNDFAAQAYDSIYVSIKPYGKYIYNRFSNVAMTGISFYKSGHYNEALQYYEWMIDHWQADQRYLDWNEAFSSLNYLYSITLDFEKAYGLYRRRARMKNDLEHVLPQIVLNLRAAYMAPLFYAGAVVLNKMKPAQINDIFSYLNTPLFPKVLLGFYWFDHYGRLKASAQGDGNADLPNSEVFNQSSSYPIFAITGGERKAAWLIAKIDKGFFAISISSALDETEWSIIKKVKDRIKEANPWFELYDYERDTYGIPVSALGVSCFIGWDKVNNSRFSISRYSTVISDKTPAMYIAVHQNDGSVMSTLQFNKDIAQYDDFDWRKSSNAKGFYRQSIQYDNKSVIDVTNPVYIDQQLHGRVRIGFRK